MRIQGLGAVPREARQKAWSWSYSKFKNYESCPRKHYEVDIAKTAVETQDNDPDSPLNWGKRLHAEFANALKNNTPLSDEMKRYQHWIDRIHNGPGQLFVEQKYAINRQFQSVGWFDDDVWVRMIGDVVRIDTPFTDRDGNHQQLALVVDWKTGKVVEEPIQLMLMAQALFSKYPSLTLVRSEFVWLKDDCTTPELFSRQEVADFWADLLPRVAAMEQAHITQNYPPKPSGLCKKHCPVSSCPYWRKGG